MTNRIRSLIEPDIHDIEEYRGAYESLVEELQDFISSNRKLSRKAHTPEEIAQEMSEAERIFGLARSIDGRLTNFRSETSRYVCFEDMICELDHLGREFYATAGKVYSVFNPSYEIINTLKLGSDEDPFSDEIYDSVTNN